MIVHQHGAGSMPPSEAPWPLTTCTGRRWRRSGTARCWAPTYHVLSEKTDTSPGGSELWFDPRRGSEKAFLKALDEMAAKSGHPELQDRAVGPLGTLGRRHLVQRDDHASSRARRGGLSALRLGDRPFRQSDPNSPNPRSPPPSTQFPPCATPA